MKYLIPIPVFILFLLCVPAQGGSRVAESTVQPDRLISSQGYIHYNYNAHLVETDMAGEQVMMYRYNWIRLKPPATKAEVEKLIYLESLDSKDTVSISGKAPLCDETKPPTWVEPEVTKKEVKIIGP